MTFRMEESPTRILGGWGRSACDGRLAPRRQSLPRLSQRALSTGCGRGFLAGTHFVRLLLHPHSARCDYGKRSALGSVITHHCR